MITRFLQIIIGRNISHHDYDFITDDLYRKATHVEKDGHLVMVIDGIEIAVYDYDDNLIDLTKEGVKYLQPIVFEYLFKNLQKFIQ